MKFRLMLCLIAAALLLGGCGGGNDDGGDAADDPDTETSSPDTTVAPDIDEEFVLSDGTIAVRAGDPTFRAPSTLPAGPTSFTLNNEGRFTHQLRLVELDEADPPLNEIAKLDPNAIPDVVDQIGFIRRVKSREVSTERIEVELEPGRYGFLCLLKDTYSQETHAAFGMSWEFTVTG
jgi:hypothetical protein